MASKTQALQIKAVNIKIYGQVQGVFFRHSAKQKAREFGVTGWIKNSEDGSVEALAQGNDGSLKKFIDWCHQGSASAQVEKVEVSWKKGNEIFEDFEIVRS